MTKVKIECVYISGRITNNSNYETQFSEAEKLLKKWGFEKIINPVEINHKDISDWQLCMSEDLSFWFSLQCKCKTGLVLLDGWQMSRGATLEKYIAEQLAIPYMPLNMWRKVAQNNFEIVKE